MEAKSNLTRPPAEVGTDPDDKPPERAISSRRLLCTNKDPDLCVVCSGAFEGKRWLLACCGSHYCASCCKKSSHWRYDENSSKLCTVCRKKALVTARDNFRAVFVAAKRGEAWAQFDVASLFAVGFGVDQSHSQVVRWLKKAAEQGHPKAIVNLAVKYDRGEGCAADPSEAERYYRMATDLPTERHKDEKYRGINNLACMITGQGRGEEARDLLLPLAAEGHADIQDSLGEIYSDYLSNEEEGVMWFRTAAIQGHSGAAQSLVESYMRLGQHALARFWMPVLMKSGIGVHEGTLVANMTALRKDEERCGACAKTLGTPKQNMCKQCRTYCYCNRLCQIRHWNRGHGVYCKEARELKGKEEELIGLLKNAPDD